MSAGAVDEERLVRWWEEDERKGRVGVEWRRWRNQERAFCFGTRSE